MVKWRSILLGGAISAICIYFSLAQVDPAKVMDAFGQADIRWLIATLIPILVSLAARCGKWQLLFLPDERISFGGAFSSTMIGYLFNALLPGRVGEVVRSALLSQTERVSPVRAFGTIFVEKLIDVLLLVALLGCLTAFISLPEWVARAGLTVAVGFGALGVVFVVLCTRRAAFVNWLEQHVDALPLVRRAHPSRLASVLLSAADSLRYPRLLVPQVLLTVLMWGCAYATVAATAWSFRAAGLDLPWTALALVLVATNLGMTVPAAPASLGVYHGMAVAVLALFGVDKSLALSFAVALHALGFGTMMVIGATTLLAGLVTQRYTMTGLWRWQQPQRIGTLPAQP
jgi:uncharacterized protein (TIRG00374 family)